MRLVDVTRDACNDTPGETPLYSMLTPHHRLELVADVVAALCDPTTPLPKDDPEHQAAFLAVWGTVLCQLVMEMDMDEGAWTDDEDDGCVPGGGGGDDDDDDDDDDEDASDAAAGGGAGSITAEMYEGALSKGKDFAARGKAYLELDKKHKQKLEKKMRKDEEREATGGARGAGASKSRTDISGTMGQIERLSNSGSFGYEHAAAMARSASRRSVEELTKMAEEESNSSRSWRLLLLAAFDERRKGMPSAIKLTPGSRDRDAWTLQYRMFVGAGF
jgi:hypothetical protein